MLSSLRSRNLNCEEEAKFIQDRIVSAERNLAEFCYIFAQYSRKVARVRDKGDAIAQVALTFAESERVTKSLSLGLANFSSAITTISDYGDLRVQHIDHKVTHEFSQYEAICKQAKEEVKHIFSARDKELNRKKQLDRIREKNPRNRQQIVQAETELVKATSEVSRTICNLEEKITTFERQKLHDVKGILLDFITGEMGYHAKALEQLTKAYQDIQSIDEEADLEEFKNSLHSANASKSNVGTTFLTSQSLGSINTLFGGSHRNRFSPGIPIPAQRKNVSKSVEVLDSDVSESNSNETENQSKDKASPFTAGKYLK